MLPDPNDGNINFYIPWTSLTISTPSSNKTIPINVPTLLDTGHTGISVPQALLEPIVTELDIRPTMALCDLLSSDITLLFGFNDDPAATIAVRLADMAAPFKVNGTDATAEDGSPACRPPADAADSTYATFGDSFMRSAYTVFDLENKRISIAQARLNATRSDVVEIGPQGVGSSNSSANATTPTVSGPPASPPTHTGAAAALIAHAPIRMVSLFVGGTVVVSALGGSFALLI